MTPEDEEFNRVEMESRIKQEYVRSMRKTTREEKISNPAVYEVPTENVQFVSISMEDYVEITQKLALARIQIKELEERIKELEGASNTLNEMRKRYDNHFAKAMGVKK